MTYHLKQFKVYKILNDFIIEMINTLLEIRMGAMSEEYLNQLADPRIKVVSFEDYFSMLVDIEIVTKRTA